MSSVWYIGDAIARIIRAEDWTAAGHAGKPEARWDSSNGYSQPQTAFTVEQLTLLDADDAFSLTATDGPRPGAIVAPGREVVTRGWVTERIQQLEGGLVPRWKPSTDYVAGQSVTAPDGAIVRAKVDFTSASAFDSTKWEYGTIPGGANVPVAKSSTDIRAGVWEYTHNSKAGYLYHLLAGANFGGGAILAIGHDADDGTGTALLLAEKANGKGLVIDQRSTKTSATAYGFHATNASTAAPLVRLEQVVTDAAPALQVLALGSPGANQVLAYFGDAAGAAGRIYGDTGQLRWMRNVEVRDKNGSTLSRISVRGDDGVANPSSVHHDRTGVEFRTYAGSGTSYWPKRLFHNGNQLKIQGSATVSGMDTVPGAWVDGLTFEFNTGAAKLGFFGAAPAAKPTGVAVDAAAIHAALVTLGLIAA